MSRAHVTLLSSLLVAILALPAGAQTPTGSESTASPPSDTAVADSVAPKKKSRFGGMMNKAKAVAGNKALQNAAKGAATNVACTAVPGAAVVAAATGSGPCANSGLAGLMKSGGLAGAATSLAGGAAANAAAKAAGNLTGVKGAAATGALGAVGGQGGLKQAAAAAAANAMGGQGGLKQAAAAAAANAMMGKGGAAVTGNAAAMAAAQAAAAGMMSGAGTAALKKGANAKTAMPPGADMGAAMAAMGAAMGAVGTATAGASKVETVDFRELKALLPASLRGMSRTEATGEKQGAMGIQISNAEGRYASEDGKSVKVTITDMGSLTGLAGGAAYAWASTEVDREGDSGYEKTTTFKGFKALEKYDRQSKSGELAVLIEGRFVVSADGNGVDMEAIKSALGSVDLRKIAGMKGKGVKK